MNDSLISIHLPTPSNILQFNEVALKLHPIDDVAIAKITLMSGNQIVGVDDPNSSEIKLLDMIPWSHKFALHDIPKGEPVRRYGQLIGFARKAIRTGEHVHVHNLEAGDYLREASPGAEVKPIIPTRGDERRKFQGFKRPDGRVGTRNYVAVISTVNCSAHTCREIAHYFTKERLSEYPNVDGVMALTHTIGCGQGIGTHDYQLLQRTLAGMAHHPNVAASLIIGLGCESNQPAALVANCPFCSETQQANGHPFTVTVQDGGGIRRTVKAGIEAIEEILPVVNDFMRSPQLASELMLALQCGGSDAWSGVTANPVVGHVADQVIRQGGTVVLAETPEIIGAEHLLIRRTIDPKTAESLAKMVDWWWEFARRQDLDLEFNRSVGNAAGGLSTIYEKSLGAVAKGGTTPLVGVYEYAEPVTTRGFNFMNSPGYDPVSVTGEVAGGSNLVLFTTGRGSVFGFKPAPSIKISSNSQVYQRMPDDIDFNAGIVLEGTSIDQAGDNLFELVLSVASGEPSKSEAQGVGEAEFIPWATVGSF
jgi:altronate hydrolase